MRIRPLILVPMKQIGAKRHPSMIYDMIVHDNGDIQHWEDKYGIFLYLIPHRINDTHKNSACNLK